MALDVRIVSPSRVVYEGEASSLVAPAWDGKVGILPSHAPMIALLGAGWLTLDLPGGGSRSMYVAGGVLQVVSDRVTVLSEYAGEAAPEQLPESYLEPEEIEDYIGEPSRGNPLV